MQQEQNQEQSQEQTVRTPRRKMSWKTIYGVLTAIVIVGLGIYISFFSESSIMRAVAYQKTIDSLQNCIQEQQDSLDYYRDLNRRLSTDPSLTEQVVREQYNMKRDNEDVFVFK